MDSEMDEGVSHILGMGQQNLIPTTDDFQKVSVLYTSVYPQDRELANHLVHYLQNHPRSYQTAVHMYTNHLNTNHPPMLDWTKFLCLQIINDYVVSNYSQLSMEEINYIKTFMNTWLSNEVKNPSTQLVKHKMAVLFSTFFLYEFPATWPTYFEDLLQSCNLGREGVDNFLRVLIYICDEIGERDTSSKDQIHIRNTTLKDAMREGNTLQLIIRKIQNILMYCCPVARKKDCLDLEITKQALSVVEKYVNWIDIDLVANDEMFGSIINILNYKEVKHHAIDCIHEIIYKGMLPSNKFRTIQIISNALLFNDRYCNGPLVCDEVDEEYESRVGRLLNTIGLELIKIINRIAPETTIDGQCVLTTLHKYVEIMINILACEFDDVSITVTEFAKSYLHVLKAKSNKLYGADPTCTNVELYFVKELLEVVVIKMRYYKSYNFIIDGELEAEFQEFRKVLNVIFENITAFNKMLVLKLIEENINQTLLLWQADESITFSDVEVICHLIYLLGESLPIEKGHNHFTSPSVGQKMIGIMNAVLASDLSKHPHYTVCLYFFEIVCRFDKFFKIPNGAEKLKSVITAFLMERGLRHPDERVRSRLSFLFSRFVRTLKEEISIFSREVLILMEPLVSNSNGMIANPYLSHDDQLYVYETICFLVLNLPMSGTSTEKANHFKSLLAPIRHQVEMFRTALLTEQIAPNRQLLMKELSHRIAIAGRCSKSFTCRKNMQDEGVLDIFVDLMMLFISLVEEFSFEKPDVDAAVRQYLHRMVIYLEEEMLPITPKIFFAFAKVPNPAVLNDFMPLLTQMVIRFKRNLYESLLTFRSSLFGVLGKALGTEINGFSNSNEDHYLTTDKLMLRKSYYQFVTAMLNNNLEDLFLLEDVFDFFIKDILHVINRESDPLLKKNVIFILRKTMELWNNENYHEIIFSTVVPPFFASLNNGLLFHSTESNFSSAADEATNFIIFLFKQNPNRTVEKLRNELVICRAQSVAERFVLCLEGNPKNGFKMFRQFLKATLTSINQKRPIIGLSSSGTYDLEFDELCLHMTTTPAVFNKCFEKLSSTFC